jgi:hypothetical protein
VLFEIWDAMGSVFCESREKEEGRIFAESQRDVDGGVRVRVVGRLPSVQLLMGVVHE